MRSLYILTIPMRGTQFGVGTYIKELLRVCKKEYTLIFHVIIASNVSELKVEKSRNVTNIIIPQPVYKDSKMKNQLYMNMLFTNVVYILKPYVNLELENIFHINFLQSELLATELKEAFHCKVVLTLHYTEWSFSLLGNKQKLKRLKKKKKLLPYEQYVLELYNNDYKLLNNNSIDKIIAISIHSYEDITHLFSVSPEKVVCIPNALSNSRKQLKDSEKLLLKQKFNISSETKVILFVGRLDPVKGVSYLIKAFHQLIQKHWDVHLFLIGEGKWDTYMHIADPNYSKISFTGYLSRKELYELYRLADIGVVPSLHEEFGLVPLEMMIHKLPVVTNRTTGFLETVVHNQTGLYTDCNMAEVKEKVAVDDLANKIEILLNDEPLRRKMGENGRKHFLKNFNIRVYQNRMLDLYSSLFE